MVDIQPLLTDLQPLITDGINECREGCLAIIKPLLSNHANIQPSFLHTFEELFEAIAALQKDKTLTEKVIIFFQKILEVFRAREFSEASSNTEQVVISLQHLLKLLHTKEFFDAFAILQKDKTSSKTEQAIFLGQNLLKVLPTTSPLYSQCSCCLAHSLLVTWEKTNAEEKRDRELLSIITSRVDSAVKFCLPADRFRGWYLSTQQQYYCIVQNFSARLEDDFWDHEHINTLNASIVYAKAAWHILRDNVAAARHTATTNLGHVYMSRYLYLGRPGDLEDALRFSTMSVIMSTQLASKLQLQSYTSQAMRLSLWSQFEDQPDELDDAIDYISQVVDEQSWEADRGNVTITCGSGYAVILCFSSQICYRVFTRRKGQASNSIRYLELAVSYAHEAVMGMKEIDPGRLLCLGDSANAYLQLYLRASSQSALEGAIQAVTSALEISSTMLKRKGMHRRYNGIRMTGRGGGLSNLCITDNRTSSNQPASLKEPFSLKERRYQRWIMQILEISADVLLARYQNDRHPQDLVVAITALKVGIQGIHGWHPRRNKMLFKLNQALRERVRIIESNKFGQIDNFLRRLRKAHTSFQHLEDLRHINPCRKGELECFRPLVRKPCIASVINSEPANDSTWHPVIPRGAYDQDMQLSFDAPNILTSDFVLADTRHILHRLDPQIDGLFKKLKDDDPETTIIRYMWNGLYCSAGASLKRAEVYQRALMAFVNNGDVETACQLSDLVEPMLGHIMLYLMEPQEYLSDMTHASNLAITIACVWLKQDRDPWTALIVLENGRELASRHGMNAVRSYGFDSAKELLPRVDMILNQLQTHARSNLEYNATSRFTEKSNDLVQLLKDVAHSETCLTPFGRRHCMWEASSGFIVHLVTSTLGTYALITTSNDLHKLKLVHCTNKQLRLRATKFRGVIERCENQKIQKGEANRELRLLLAWLWKTLAKPVLKHLLLQKSRKYSSDLPRIKWVACGVFSQLPIHAAGIYSDTVSDYMDQYVVSSYMSSIRATVALQQRKPLIPFYQNANRDFTLFGMSSSPIVPEGKLADLAVEEETRRIFKSLGGSFTNKTIENCNIGAAQNMMFWARIVHFTCHGISNSTDPSKSRLVLLRDDKEPCTVAKVREMDIPNALLLFLSACHSAIDPQAGETDEIIHLAKAFLLAGFPTVIGTLWQAYQTSAIDIAETFYAHVAKEWKVGKEEPDPDLFPRALHLAIWKWRDGGNAFKQLDWASWVCFHS